ncbi:unnamed protein product [Chrysoparadoxa australica]
MHMQGFPFLALLLMLCLASSGEPVCCLFVLVSTKRLAQLVYLNVFPFEHFLRSLSRAAAQSRCRASSAFSGLGVCLPRRSACNSRYCGGEIPRSAASADCVRSLGSGAVCCGCV